MPLDGCESPKGVARDVFAEYTTARGAVALTREQLLPVAVPAGTQPCATFGLHPAMTFMKSLFDEGDAAIVANAGNLIRPLTAKQIKSGQYKKEVPPGMFAHNLQRAHIRTCDPRGNQAPSRGRSTSKRSSSRLRFVLLPGCVFAADYPVKSP